MGTGMPEGEGVLARAPSLLAGRERERRRPGSAAGAAGAAPAGREDPNRPRSSRGEAPVEDRGEDSTGCAVAATGPASADAAGDTAETAADASGTKGEAESPTAAVPSGVAAAEALREDAAAEPVPGAVPGKGSAAQEAVQERRLVKKARE